MKIAITGATGHIGTNLVLSLIENGYMVRAICRKPEKMELLGELDAEIVQGDVLHESTLLRAFKGMDVVIHLAGVISIDGDPDGSVINTNVHGTKNVVSACINNNIKHLIHFSSIHAFKYSNKSTIVNEESPYADTTSFIYDQSKALGEKEILKGKRRGLNATILCPTAVIGPNDYSNSKTGKMLGDLFFGKMPALIKGGFDWVDVRDISTAVIHILEKGAPSPRYVLSGQWASLPELAAICQQISGKKPPWVTLPIWVAQLGLPFIKIAHYFSNKPPLYTYESLMIVKNASKNYSSQLAKKELGFKTRPLKDSIEDIYKWRINTKKRQGISQPL